MSGMYGPIGMPSSPSHASDADASENKPAASTSFVDQVAGSDPQIQSWVSKTGVDGDGKFIHAVDFEGTPSDELWSNFRAASGEVRSGATMQQQGVMLFRLSAEAAHTDLYRATATYDAVGSMLTAFDGMKAAVTTKDPEAVNNSINTLDDKKAILAVVTLVEHDLENDPDVNTQALAEVKNSLIKMYNGESLSKEELVKLEPYMESYGIRLFPYEVQPDRLSSSIQNAENASQDAIQFIRGFLS